MALARVKVWTPEILTATDLNTEFNNILNYLNGAAVNLNTPTLNSPTITGTVAGGATYISPVLSNPTMTGVALIAGLYSGSFSQNPAANNTFYTAIAAATLAANRGNYWIFASSGFNVVAFAGLITQFAASPALTTFTAGSLVAVQLDGAGNFQVKQTTGVANEIHCSWLYVPAP
jgi:hypothetical protein